MYKKNTSKIGSIGENIACIFLQRKGFSIVARNYKKPWGEIDIIAEKGGVVHFVEVKSLTLPPGISRENMPIPEEQIHSLKLRKIARTAEMYMEQAKDEREFQVDSIGVLMNPETRRASCRMFEQVL